MRFLGLESPVEYLGQSVFNPAMALLLLNALRDYVNAMYADYQQGLQDMKEFNKEYGDFFSPIAADNDNYYNLTMGGIKKMFDDANAAGVDLLRSPEGRRMVLLYINTRPYGDLAKLRQSSETAKEYLKAKQVLMSKGLFNPDLENFRLKGKSLQNWDTLAYGQSWNESSPMEAVSLRDLTYDSYKGRTARTLTKDDFNDPRLQQYKYDPKYEWTGYLDSDLMKVAPGASLSLAGDVRGDFYRELAKKKVINRGEIPTADAVEKQFLRDIADANAWALIDPTRKADEFALDDYRTRNDIRAHAANKATDYYYDILPYADTDGDGKLSKDERAAYAKANAGGGKGNRRKDPVYNIFREAEDRPGFDVPFANGSELENYIAPVSNKISRVKDKSSGLYVYLIPGDMIDKVLYTEYTSRGNNNSKLYRYIGHGGDDFDRDGNYYFVYNTGGLRHKNVGGKDRYFIGGQLMKKGIDGTYSYEGSGPITYEMEVKETDHVYGTKKEE